MFLSGILPMSSALMTSETMTASRLASSDSCTERRMPVTTTSCRSGGALVARRGRRSGAAAAAYVFGPNRAHATAVPINVDLAILMYPSTPDGLY